MKHISDIIELQFLLPIKYAISLPLSTAFRSLANELSLSNLAVIHCRKLFVLFLLSQQDYIQYRISLLIYKYKNV